MAFLNESGLSHYDTKLKQYASGLVSSHNTSLNSHEDIRDLINIALHGVRDWHDVQSIVRKGLGKDVFSVGDQFTCNKSTTTLTWDLIGIDQDVPTTSTITTTSSATPTIDYVIFIAKTGEAGEFIFTYDGTDWKDEQDNTVILSEYGITLSGTAASGDIITVNIPHSITLQMHDEYSTAMRFNIQEAAFYVDADVYPSGLAAGTYNFYWNYATGSLVKGDYQFTIAQAVPVGGQIVINMNSTGAAVTSCLITTYTEVGGTTVIEDNVAISSGNAGTSLGTISKSSQTVTVNCAQRIYGGSNDWVDSDIRQWLNASGVAGTWWIPLNRFKRPNGGNAGFKNSMDSDFLDVIGSVIKKTQKNITNGYGMALSEEEIFLLAQPEVYGTLTYATDGSEGEPYSYYKDNSDLLEPGNAADSNRVKLRNSSVSAWWLRSPSVDEAATTRVVSSDGRVTTSGGASNVGVAPAVVVY